MTRPHIPQKIREQVKSKYDGRCAYCGEKNDRLQIDHLKPISPYAYWDKEKKDIHEIENLMPACAKCNNYKFCHTLEQFRKEIEESLRKAEQRSVNYRFAKRYELVKEMPKPIVFYFERLGEE